MSEVIRERKPKIREKGLSTEILLDRLKEELKTKFFPASVVENTLMHGKSFPKRNLMKKSEFYGAYLKRRDRIPTSEVLDSLWPKFPDLSYRVLGTKAVKTRFNLTPQKAGQLLREMYYKGDNIAAEALRESDDLLKRAIWDIADRTGRESKRKDEKGATAGIVRLSGISKGNFSQNGKLKIMGTVSEDFARLMLLETMIYDSHGISHTPEFRKKFPHPVIGVYPKSYDSEIKGIKLEYNHARSEDGFVLADMVVESPRDVCIVEVKNVQAKISGRIRKLSERILRKKGLHWTEGNKDVTRKTLIVHANDEQYKKLQAGLDGISDGIAIVSPNEFRKDFGISLRKLEAEGHLMTNVYSVDELLSAYDLLANRAHLLMRHNRQSENGFIGRTIETIITDLQNGVKHANLRNPEFFNYDGNITTNEHGLFQLFEIPALGVPYPNARDYLEEKLKEVPEGSVIAEVQQRWHRGHVIYASLVERMGEEIMLRIALAKNPMQEAAILKYLANELKNKNVILSDKSSDAVGIQKRFVAQLMQHEVPDSYPKLETLVAQGASQFAEQLLASDNVRPQNIDVATSYTRWENTGNPDEINPETGNPESMTQLLQQGIFNSFASLIQYAGFKK